MAIRRIWLVLPVLFFPVGAGAHEHSAEFFAAPSGELGSFLRGFHTSFDKTLMTDGKSSNWGLIGDVSVHSNASRDELTFIFGPRRKLFSWEYSVSELLGGPRNAGPKIVISAHALPLGFHQIHDDARKSGDKDVSGMVFAVGAGVDLLFRKRPQDEIQSGGRLQVDYVHGYTDGIGHWRISLGLVLRYPHEHAK